MNGKRLIEENRRLPGLEARVLPGEFLWFEIHQGVEK
jgi:hypothetical protein